MVQELWSDTFHLTARILMQRREVTDQAKDYIRGSDVAFRCCLQHHVFILHAFTQICYEKTAKVFQKLWL